jgi:hypothetical protein
MYIDSTKFNFSFFLSNRKKVKSLEEGALKYGGSTKYNTGIYSNIPGGQNIKINKSINTISIFIPSTINISQRINNKQYVQYAVNHIQRFYPYRKVIFYDTKGSWYSDSLNQVIIEDITIITLRLKELNELDINIFVDLATNIKYMMQQEGVSIAINQALAIV